MGMLKDFKEFAMRGNVVDMAVGVVVGAAFSKITSSLVDNIIMPPLGVLMGGVDFSNLFINLSDVPVKTLAEAQAANVPVIAYGSFLNAVIDFLIIAFSVFIVMRQINRFFPKKEEAPTKAPGSAHTAEKPLPMTPHAARTAPLSWISKRKDRLEAGCQGAD